MPTHKNSRPVSVAGVGTRITQEEEQGTGSSELTPSGSPSAPRWVGEESPSLPFPSSASESGSPLARRDLNRVKKGLVNVSEHLREKLKRTKQALDDETEQRKQEAPNLRKLLEDRMDMLVSAAHSAPTSSART